MSGSLKKKSEIVGYASVSPMGLLSLNSEFETKKYFSFSEGVFTFKPVLYELLADQIRAVITDEKRFEELFLKPKVIDSENARDLNIKNIFDKSNLLLGWSILQALKDWKQQGKDKKLGKVGLILATTTGSAWYWEQLLKELKIGPPNLDTGQVNPEAGLIKFETWYQQVIEELNLDEFDFSVNLEKAVKTTSEIFYSLGYESRPKELSDRWQVDSDYCFVISSACAGSTQAMGLAKNWIESDEVDSCLVCGVEVLCELTISGFRSLGLISAELCRPFDENRRGINLAEGAATLLLSSRKAHERSVEATNVESISGSSFNLELSRKKLRHFLMGYGTNSDCYHLTSPLPNGEGVAQAVQYAMADANVSPEEIAWVHAHGTGSKANDLSEASALKQFPFSPSMKMSSTKGAHGHTLAASGIIELTVILNSLSQNQVLPNFNLEKIDPLVGLKPFNLEPSKPLDELRFPFVTLKNSIGFGGTNAAIILVSSFDEAIFKNASAPKKEFKKDMEVRFEKQFEFSVEEVETFFGRTSLDPIFRKATTNMKLACKGITLALIFLKKELLVERQLLTNLEKSGLSLSIELNTLFGEFETTLEFEYNLIVQNLGRPLLFQNSLHHSTIGFVSILLKQYWSEDEVWKSIKLHQIQTMTKSKGVRSPDLQSSVVRDSNRGDLAGANSARAKLVSPISRGATLSIEIDVDCFSKGPDIKHLRRNHEAKSMQGKVQLLNTI